MKVSSLFLLSILNVLGALATSTQTTPVQKVITLLQGMLEKGKKEKHEEQVLFAETRTFCEDEEQTKTLAINEEVQTIEGLAALIAKDTADAAHLLKLISVLDENEDVWSGDIKAATKVRDIEKDDYTKTHKDYSESIDAIGHAIQVLKKQTHDRKQEGASLIQLSNLKSMSLIPDDAKRTIDAFFQQDDAEGTTDVATGAPEANAYEFQSHGVVEMLQKLLDKFLDERTTIEKEEGNSKNAYSLLMQDLKAQIVQAVKDKHGKQLSRSKKLASKADEQGDKKKEEELEATDEAYLKDLTASCDMKASDFKNRQQLRTEEIEAIEQAIETISGGAVAGNAEKHLPAMVQSDVEATSFSQLLRSTLNSEVQQRATAFLKARAAKTNSRILGAAARRTAADPFAKVKKMLKDLVVRLMEEANEEAEHKGWCDTELSTNGQTRKEKTETVETLQADIDALGASIAKLTEDIGSLSKSVADLDAAMATSTKLRTEEKAKNEETVTDAQEAQTAVAQALTVLREFYAKAAEATSFAQEPYKGMQAENGGVVGMLEVIESDFARLESETKASEATAAKEYDSFMSDSKVDRAEKMATSEHKVAKKQDENQALTEKKNDLEGSQKELDAALKYFDKLKPSCVDSGVSYEDRVERRKGEIESLQEGLKILNGEDIA